MTTASTSLGLFILLLSCTGCAIGTRQPLYDAKRDVIYDARLAGEWRNDDFSIRFSRGPGNSYRIDGLSRVTSTDDSKTLCAHLVRIGKYHYLFFVDSQQQTGTLLFPCFRVTVEDEQMRMQLLNVGFIADDIEKHPLALKHEFNDVYLGTTQPADPAVPRPVPQPLGRNMILTDEPQAIREYFMLHQDDKDWVVDMLVLHKVREYSRK